MDPRVIDGCFENGVILLNIEPFKALITIVSFRERFTLQQFTFLIIIVICNKIVQMSNSIPNIISGILAVNGHRSTSGIRRC